MNCKYKWLGFLNAENALLINNEVEFNQFKSFLQYLGMVDILKQNTEFIDWKHLASINNYPTNYIIFECNYHKGLSFGATKEEVKNFYEVDPLTVNDLELIQNNIKDKNINDRGR